MIFYYAAGNICFLNIFVFTYSYIFFINIAFLIFDKSQCLKNQFINYVYIFPLNNDRFSKILSNPAKYRTYTLRDSNLGGILE